MGVIQCGSFSGNTTTTLGWEPQWVMIKRTDAAGDWIVVDSARGCSVGGVDAVLYPNLSSAESIANDYIDFTATGFISKNLTGTYIFTAIRRSNKPPTLGTQVYGSSTVNGGKWSGTLGVGAGSGQMVTGEGADLIIDFANRAIPTSPAWLWSDRLRGFNKTGFAVLNSSTTDVETIRTTSPYRYRDEDYFYLAPSSGMSTSFFKRAPGVFDIVCYTGDASYSPKSHNLQAQPELIILKNRTTTENWETLAYISNVASWLVLNSPAASIYAPGSFTSVLGNESASPTVSVFYPYGVTTSTTPGNISGNNYVAYLFATKAGISKVGSYTGNGSSQTINCGFTTGCRFIMIKRTDSTGDWYIWDTVRGIVAGNDPHLALNTAAVEITTDDSIDPAATGFIVNQVVATNINVTSATYIFLSFA